MSSIRRAAPRWQRALRTVATAQRRYMHAVAAIEVDVKGIALLNSPRLNKGSAFPMDERERFDLTGLLPEAVNTLELQSQRAKEQLNRLHEPIAKHDFLDSMRTQNQVLFYKLLEDDLKRLLPIIYTPTVGQSIQEFSHRFRRPEGVFLSYPNRDRMERDLLLHGGKDDIDLIVVTDGEGILGIGDQGAGGIGITGGKGSLYTCAGIDPNRVLCVGLDVGTDNHALLSDDLYLGWRSARVRGAEYDAFIDQFVRLVAKHYPNALLHCEDFGVGNASRILKRYKDEVSIFNDDIQGTGATALAALLSALKVKGGERLKDQRIIVHGAGTAGQGIADRLAIAMSTADGISYEEAAKRFYLIDRQGLLLKSMEPSIRDGLQPFLRDDAEVKDWPRIDSNQPELRLLDVVKAVRPTVLIGTSTQARAFNEDVVKEMAKHSRPIILPLSNPTSRCEGDPAQIAAWTDNSALVACGSPFPPVTIDGSPRRVAECNNALVYPGLGLGTILSKADRLSESMIVAGVNALAKLSPALEDDNAPLLPDLGDLREISARIASTVMLAAKKEGIARATVEDDETERLAHIREVQWRPVYRPLVLKDPEHATSGPKLVETSRRPGELGGDGAKAKH